MRTNLDVTLFPDTLPAFIRSRETIRGAIHGMSEDGPMVDLTGVHPVAGWMEYLHLPLGFLARIMFTMPHDSYYGCQYFLEALQEAETAVHLESLSLELSVGLSLRHPEWLDRSWRCVLRQRVRAQGNFLVVEASFPDQQPGAQIARSFVHLALEVHRRLPPLQGEQLLRGLRRMAEAYLSGEVNPYDWKSLVTFPQVVYDDLLGNLARRARAEA